MLLALLVLTSIIIVHELGHYLTARFFGMKVDVFSVGFGPSLLKWRGKSTTYQLCIIPFGGYVKIRGFSNNIGIKAPYDDQNFNNFPRWQRAVVLVAGVGANLFSVLIGTILVFWLHGTPQSTTEVGTIQLVNDVYKESPLKPGDIINSVNGTPTPTGKDVVKEFRSIDVTREKLLEIKRGDKVLVVRLKPEKNITITLKNKLYKAPFLGAVKRGALESATGIIQTAKGMGNILVGQINLRDGVAGPIGIVQITKIFSQSLA